MIIKGAEFFSIKLVFIYLDATSQGIFVQFILNLIKSY